MDTLQASPILPSATWPMPARPDWLSVGSPDVVPDKAPPGVWHDWVYLYRELAQVWLGMNTANRKQDETQIAQMQRDQAIGHWIYRGDTVVFARDGSMISGQARCEMVARSGIPEWVLVVAGVEPDVREVIDTGRSQTLSDSLERMGEVNLAALGSAIALGCRWSLGLLDREASAKPSRVEILRWFKDHSEGMREAVRVVKPVAKAPLYWPASSAAIVVDAFCRNGYRDQVARFLYLMASNDNTSDQKYGPDTFRQWLSDARVRRPRPRPGAFLNAAVLALNAFVTERRVTQAQLSAWMPGRPIAEVMGARTEGLEEPVTEGPPVPTPD